MPVTGRFAPEAVARKLIRQLIENLLLVGISGPCPSKIRATRSTNSVGFNPTAFDHAMRLSLPAFNSPTTFSTDCSLEVPSTSAISSERRSSAVSYSWRSLKL
jgi:hypothetical protein